ncbi:ral guanine nucleotide dissociation stimulator-like isoform X1 [Alligator mississippiensis]|uniref:ral guanine nucleotide dissociation stimulator-like isoform X1 n=1 Tax=Alligator mississippiensis TaxID=8496 RepID=UPI00287731A4|nr:ral guanine nucleotide dissociation stimulator-like isoform X1 [Alligator mississippiensis]
MGSFGDTGRAEQEEGYGCSCIPLPSFLQRLRTREPRPRAGSQEGQEQLFDSGDWRTLQAQWRQQLQLQVMQKNVDALLEDFGNIHTFFATYRTFASPGEVLEMLLSRHGKLETLSCRGDESPDFSADSRAVLRNPIIFFLKTWLHFSPEDFKELPKYHTLRKVIAHLSKNVPGCDIEMEAKHLLHQFQNEAENESQPEDQPGDQPGDQPKGQPRELPEVQPGKQPKGQPGEQPEDQPGVHPKDQPGDQPEGQPGALPKDQPRDLPEVQPGEQPEGQPEDQPGDQPKGQPKDQPEAHLGDRPWDLPEVQPKGQPGEQPEIQPGVQPEGQPGEQREEQPGDQPKGQLGDLHEVQPRDLPKVQPGVQTEGQPEDQPGDQPEGQPRDQPEDHLGDRPWDLPESQPGDLPRVQPKGQPRDLSGDQPRNLPQEKNEDAYVIHCSVPNSQGAVYKGILLTSQDTTRDVISKIMRKYDLDMEEAGNYQLVQVISEHKELVFPQEANVLSYMNSQGNADISQRRKPAFRASPLSAAAKKKRRRLPRLFRGSRVRPE